MPTYFSIDIAAGDVPSVGIGVGDHLSIIKFTKTCEFIVPQPGKKAIWPDGEKAAKESGIDLHVHPYTWWVVMDNFAQVGVTYKPAFGDSYIVEIGDGRTNLLLKITPAEAKEMFESLRKAMGNIKKYLHRGSAAIFKPAETVLEYHVRTWVYREDRTVGALPPHGPFPPKFR